MPSTVRTWVLSTLVLAASAATLAQSAKITPLGSHAGEYCATDRALLLQDPTRVRLVEGRAVHLSLSGRTMEFDGAGKCLAGC